ncbi:MAG: hypothetical protein AXW17_03200 [Colwellia sp. Phe_37]|nr:MAG: hypothetical protein AXW17_03200 [Colwellia sp. Phe_37]
MARNKPIILENGTNFLTQKETIEYFKDLLDSISLGNSLTPEHAAYSNLLSLYKRHPEFEFKSRNEENVLYFLIKNSGQYNTKCFHAVHADGSQADWSYKTAINSKGKTVFQCFVDGARHSLEMESPRFRDADFTNKCKQFINLLGIEESTIPNDWVSQPDKVQYRSILKEPIKTQFKTWYKNH